MGCRKAVDVEKEEWLLEQGVRSRLYTNNQTGRRSGDGDWSRGSALKRHRVRLSQSWGQRGAGEVVVIWQLGHYHMSRSVSKGGGRRRIGCDGDVEVETRARMDVAGSRRVKAMQGTSVLD